MPAPTHFPNGQAIPDSVRRWYPLLRKYFGDDDDLIRKAMWVIYYESGGNPEAVGDGGNAIGLFQIHHGGSIPGRPDANWLKDPENNIRYAALNLGAARGNWKPWGEGTHVYPYDYDPRTGKGRFGALGYHPYPGQDVTASGEQRPPVGERSTYQPRTQGEWLWILNEQRRLAQLTLAKIRAIPGLSGWDPFAPTVDPITGAVMMGSDTPPGTIYLDRDPGIEGLDWKGPGLYYVTTVKDDQGRDVQVPVALAVGIASREWDSFQKAVSNYWRAVDAYQQVYGPDNVTFALELANTLYQLSPEYIDWLNEVDEAERKAAIFDAAKQLALSQIADWFGAQAERRLRSQARSQERAAFGGLVFTPDLVTATVSPDPEAALRRAFGIVESLYPEAPDRPYPNIPPELLTFNPFAVPDLFITPPHPPAPAPGTIPPDVRRRLDEGSGEAVRNRDRTSGTRTGGRQPSADTKRRLDEGSRRPASRQWYEDLPEAIVGTPRRLTGLVRGVWRRAGDLFR